MIILKWAKKFNKGENGDFNMRKDENVFQIHCKERECNFIK